MPLHRHLAPVLVITLVTAACRSGTEPLPTGAVTGTWGGDKTELVAHRNEVLLHSACLGVRFPHALIIAADGEVILPIAPILIDGAITGLALIEGRAMGDTLNLEIRLGGPYGASLEHVKLVRGQKVDFAGILCAVPGPGGR
jgi:hypothetical protein